MRLLTVVIGVVLLAACGGSGEDSEVSIDARSAVDAGSAATATTDESAPPPTAGADGHPRSKLIEFRDSAAAAPFWSTVDWQPPVTVADMAHGQDRAMTGKLVEAVVPGEPRADGLVPHEGAPTLYHHEVRLMVLDEDGSRHMVQVPVLSSGASGISGGAETARRICELAPLGALVVIVSNDHGASLVAVAAEDRSLVGYYASLDDAVSRHTLDSLRAALDAALAS